MKYILVLIILAISSPVLARTPEVSGSQIISGFEPKLEARGLAPLQRVRIHVVRMFSIWQPSADGEWREVPKPLHAWADFIADSNGTVEVWRASPLAGTYAGIDPYGLLWSGRPIGGAAVDFFLPNGFDSVGLRDGEARILLTVDGVSVAADSVAFMTPEGLTIENVSSGRLNGVYAAPDDGEKHPALILLHGSEGGSADAARELAVRFAGQGYAAFAFNYFAWDLANLEGVPNAHVNQPVEMIGVVRDWLATRPEADVERLGLYGHSKGAEYAEVAAIRLPWIKAVAACVPTDVVWQGYGIGDERNRSNSFGAPPDQYSSFSWQGAPLPYVPLDGDRSAYPTNTDFYEAKRAEFPTHASEAAIPIDQANARFLWLGAERDEVWASGTMAAELDRRMTEAGEGAKSELHVYTAAGHAICGDGTYPSRLWSDDSTDPHAPDLDANGRATVDAWRQIKNFFAVTLKANE